MGLHASPPARSDHSEPELAAQDMLDRLLAVPAGEWRSRNLRFVGRAEDEIRIDAEDALGAIEGLEVRRVFSGWGFYRRGLLFAAAWEGEFRFRTRQGRHWIYEVADRELLGRPDELVSVARGILARLEAEPAAARTGKRGSGGAHRGR